MRRRSANWILGARSETGYVRSVNEDRMLWAPTAFGNVIVLADGMGGYQGGAQAAEITVQTLKDRLSEIPPGSDRFGDAIRAAFVAANREVYSQRNPEDPQTREMGATGLAVITSGSRAIVGHIGDSRAYLWRRGAGLRPLTSDHTMVQSMLNAGMLTPEEASAHPDASVLDRAIGHQPTVQADVSDWISLESGDTLLLCSDGLCGYVSDTEIEAIMQGEDDPQATTDKLIDIALSKGGHDNVTVQLARYAPRSMKSLTRLAAAPTLWMPVGMLLAGLGGYFVAEQFLESDSAKVGELTRQLTTANETVASLKTKLAAAAAQAAAAASATKAPVAPASAPVVVPEAAAASAPTTGRATTAKPARAPASPSTRLNPTRPAPRTPTNIGPAKTSPVTNDKAPDKTTTPEGRVEKSAEAAKPDEKDRSTPTKADAETEGPAK